MSKLIIYSVNRNQIYLRVYTSTHYIVWYIDKKMQNTSIFIYFYKAIGIYETTSDIYNDITHQMSNDKIWNHLTWKYL